MQYNQIFYLENKRNKQNKITALKTLELSLVVQLASLVFSFLFFLNEGFINGSKLSDICHMSFLVSQKD